MRFLGAPMPADPPWRGPGYHSSNPAAAEHPRYAADTTPRFGSFLGFAFGSALTSLGCDKDPDAGGEAHQSAATTDADDDGLNATCGDTVTGSLEGAPVVGPVWRTRVGGTNGVSWWAEQVLGDLVAWSWGQTFHATPRGDGFAVGASGHRYRVLGVSWDLPFGSDSPGALRYTGFARINPCGVGPAGTLSYCAVHQEYTGAPPPECGPRGTVRLRGSSAGGLVDMSGPLLATTRTDWLTSLFGPGGLVVLHDGGLLPGIALETGFVRVVVDDEARLYCVHHVADWSEPGLDLLDLQVGTSWRGLPEVVDGEVTVCVR